MVDATRNTEYLNEVSIHSINAEMWGSDMADPDLDNRVFVLETKQQEVERRQKEADERQRSNEVLIQEIGKNTAVMNHTLETLTGTLMPKFETMEKQLARNTTIVNTVAWVAGAVSSAVILALVTKLFAG